jgi:hypothetical protein
MSRLSVSAYVEFHQHTNRTFDPYMPIVIIGGLAGGAALAVMYGVHSIPGQLAAEGTVCYALVIIIGVPTCVRMNHQIASWSIQTRRANGPKCVRDGRFHVIRTLFSVPGLTIYLLVVMSNTGHRRLFSAFGGRSNRAQRGPTGSQSQLAIPGSRPAAIHQLSPSGWFQAVTGLGATPAGSVCGGAGRDALGAVARPRAR